MERTDWPVSHFYSYLIDFYRFITHKNWVKKVDVWVNYRTVSNNELSNKLFERIEDIFDDKIRQFGHEDKSSFKKRTKELSKLR